jgi:hypothetical protein
MGLWQYSIMSPLLLIAAKIKKVGDQRKYLVELQSFLTKVMSDRSFAREVMTVRPHGTPLTFLPDSDLKEFYSGLTPAHRLAYENLCQSQSNDELVLDLLQFSAAHMVKKQLNMSADMILEEAKREFFTKPADNVAAERWFGFVDWRKKLTTQENILRTDAILCWTLNDVSSWLAKMPVAEQERLIRMVSSVEFRNKMLDKQKFRNEAAEQAAKERVERLEAKGRLKDQQAAAILSLADLWDADEASERVAGMVGAQQKRTALKDQWKCVHGWCKKLNLKFPFERQPKGSAVDTWLQSVIRLLQTDEVNKIKEARSAEGHKGQELKKNAVHILEEKSRSVHYAQCNKEKLLQWCTEVIDSADKDVDRSRKHRGQRKAAAAVQMGPASAPVQQATAGDPGARAVDEAGGEEDEDIVVQIEDNDENGDQEIERLFDWADAVQEL